MYNICALLYVAIMLGGCVSSGRGLNKFVRRSRLVWCASFLAECTLGHISVIGLVVFYVVCVVVVVMLRCVTLPLCNT